MRKRLKISGLSYSDCITLCFFLGLIGGCAAVNLSGSGLQSRFGYLGNIFSESIAVSAEGKRALMISIFRQRALETGIGLLAGLTVFAAPAFYIAALYFGTSVGVIASVFTAQSGMLGLPCYIISMFPQCLFYIPLWCILAKMAGEARRKQKLSVILGIILLLVCGSVTEAYINPVLLNRAMRIISVNYL